MIQSRTRKRAGSYACASHHYRDLTIAALSARLQTRTRKRAGSSACQSVPIRDLTIAALYAVKILYLAHRIPYPPNKGDKIRSFHEIKHFSRNHQLHLLAFDDNPGDARHADALLRLCSTVEIVPLDSRRQSTRALLSMLSGNPWTLGYFRSPEMQRKVAAKLKDANLAFVYSSSMAPYVANAPVPKVLDFVDSDAAKWQQYSERKSPSFLYSYEAHRLAQFEQQMTARFDFSVFVSPREAEHLPKSDRIRFITNGIDLDFYQPINTNTKSHDIIFTGLMDYFPNIDAAVFFARDVFPLIRSRVPDARFVIAGARPSASVKRLSRIPGVTITGTVPDIRPYLAQSRVAVVPLRISQGIQNKVLEALAMGLPVVTTPQVASGLPELPLSVAEDVSSFASAVTQCLLSPSRPEGARELLKKHYDWPTNLSKFDELLLRANP